MKAKIRLDLAKSLAPKLSLTYQESERFIVEFIDLLCENLTSGNMIKLKGFGTFYPVRKQRLVRNPNTGEVFKRDHATVRFRASSKFKKVREE